MTFPPHRSAPLSNQQQQVRLVVEEDAFEPGFTTRVGSADCLYRKLWDVAFYSPQARLVSLNELTSSVPFVCVASAEKSEGKHCADAFNQFLIISLPSAIMHL